MPAGNELGRKVIAAIRLSANVDAPTASERRRIITDARADLVGAGVADPRAAELAETLISAMAGFADALVRVNATATALEVVMESFVREMEKGDENARD